MSELLFTIPDHWEGTSLGEACERGGGDVQTGPFGSQLHAADYVPSGIPSIMPQNIGDNRISEDGIARITPADAQRLSRYLVRAGDIVYSRRGDVERRALIREREVGWLCGTGCLRVRFGEGVVHPPYAAYYLGHPIVREWIVRHAQGATMPNLNTTILSSLPFVLPPLEDQRVIAHILGSLDDKIELNRRMNETLATMARAIFQSWFVDFDPVRAKASGERPDAICQRLGLTPELLALFPNSIEDSELGEIPAGWNYSTLAAEAKRYGGVIQTGPFGSQLHASDYVDEGVPVVMPQDLNNRRISVDRIVRVTDEMAQRLTRHRVKSGDVVYSRRGDVERHALVSDREMGWLCGTGCLLVRLGAAWPSQAYLSEVLDLPVTREWLVRHAVGATMPNLNTSILGDVPLLMPSQQLLHAFEVVAGPFRNQQVASSVESDSLAHVRDALLPRLLSGELSIADTQPRIQGHPS